MRDFKKRRYLFALIITVAIFFLGFFFGFIMDIQRVDYFTSLNEEQKLDLRSIQLQYDLVESAPTDTQCNAFRFVFDNAINELEQNRERLEVYDAESRIKKADFDVLRREYTLSQINFWQISQEIKKSCPQSSDFVTIIYFFSDEDTCGLCDNQASVLNYYKSQLKEGLLVFAIDEKLAESEPVISLLKQTYNVTSYPTLIINGKKYTGYVGKDTMGQIICNSYDPATLMNYIKTDSLSCE